jgi:hypothetical protein
MYEDRILHTPEPVWDTLERIQHRAHLYPHEIRLFLDRFLEMEIGNYSCRHTSKGATWKQLRYIAALANLTQRDRFLWYEIAESLNISSIIASEITKSLPDREYDK